MTESFIHVVAGVLSDSDERVLVTQRGVDKHLAGKWEFPGGKVDPGEDAYSALRRELREEIGIEAAAIEPLLGVPWHYGDKAIFLDAYRVTRYSGTPHGRENQRLAWHAIDNLTTLDMPPPDFPIVNALRLPGSYAITPEPGGDDASFLAAIERALSRGIRLVQLRAKRVEPERLRRLAMSARNLAEEFDAQLLVNDAVDIAVACAADGVHLSSAALIAATSRPLGADKWVAASCHDESEIRKANNLGVDFGVLGPVAATRSHAGVQPMGWPRFAELCALAAFPLYALGGLCRGELRTARDNGAQGIAGISAFF